MPATVAPALRAGFVSAALVLLHATALAAAAPVPVGIADLLRALGATGVDILYSSDLVPRDLPAPAVLHGADPLSRAIEALSMHGLLLRQVGYRRYVVTRGPVQPRLAGAVAAGTESLLTAGGPEEVAVFASRYTLGVPSKGEAAAVGRTDLEQAPGAHSDAVRALRGVPGLSTNLSSQPYVRGAFLGDVLVQFDGIPLTDPFHFKNFQSLISAFDPSAVDRIDVYTGGFPVQYGTRSAGVIDLAPRSLDAGYEHSIGASLLNYTLSSVGRGSRWPVEWLFAARSSSRDLTLKPIDGDVGEPAFRDVLARLQWQASDESRFTVGTLLLHDDIRLASDPAEEQANATFRDLSAWIVWTWAPPGDLEARTSIAYTISRDRRAGVILRPAIATGRLNDRRDGSTVHVRSEWTGVPATGLTWTAGAGAGVEYARLAFDRREQFAIPVAAGFGRPTDSSLAATADLRAVTSEAFASLRRAWGPLDAEFGARLDVQSYRGLGSHSQLSPRLNVRYDPRADWHLYGSWGHFTQAQRVGEWRTEEAQVSPDSATRSVHQILGVRHNAADGADWRLEAYRNVWSAVPPYFDNLLDPVALVAELEPDRVRVVARNAETAGMELSARGEFGEHVALWGAYALARTTDDLQGSDVPRSWDQTHAVTAGLAWHRARTMASAVVSWHSGWPRTETGVPLGLGLSTSLFPVGPRNGARWGSYLSADLRISQSLRVGHGEVELWLDATNLTDRRNPCCVSFAPAPVAGLTTDTRMWLPRIINAGFDWRFRAP